MVKKVNNLRSVIVPILVLIVILLLIIIVFRMIKNPIIKEKFGIQSFYKSPECEKYKKYFKSCDAFIQTIDNGGIQQTPEVTKCSDYCYINSYASYF